MSFHRSLIDSYQRGIPYYGGSIVHPVFVVTDMAVCPTICLWLHSFGECLGQVLCTDALFQEGAVVLEIRLLMIYFYFYFKIFKSFKI